jgi:hypothetical protein
MHVDPLAGNARLWARRVQESSSVSGLDPPAEEG